MNQNIEFFAKYVAKCAGLDADKIVVRTYDLDRVYLSYDGTEYTIRMWNISNAEVKDYTLFRMVSDGSGYLGEEVYRGEHYYIC